MLDIDPNRSTHHPQPNTSQDNAPSTWSGTTDTRPVQSAPKERKSTTNLSSTLMFLGTLTIFTVALGAGLYFLGLSKNSQTQDAQADIAIQDENIAKLSEVEVRAISLKAQYDNLLAVLNERNIWTSLIDVMKSDTLKAASYTDLSAENTAGGMVSLNGQTDSLTNVAKLVVALQQSENFTLVTLSGITLPSEDSSEVGFSIELKVVDQILNPFRGQAEGGTDATS
jgi:Tfp pilus assembly protein PilN